MIAGICTQGSVSSSYIYLMDTHYPSLRKKHNEGKDCGRMVPSG